jgi:hypothetical protein
LELVQDDPTLYQDEIQMIIDEELSVEVSKSTIQRELHDRLHLTNKVARTMNPGQCEIKRAIYTGQVADLPAHYMVFVGK